MPFIQQTLRVFSRQDIESLNPNQSGVYGIFNQSKWIYIGKADDIRRRMLEHLNGDNPNILMHGPTHWVGEIHTDPSTREKQLILEFNPPCNQRVG